ncbi:MAG: kinase/pyrophosphorylase [Thiogranum sp.]|nr:kinase/pyrophosphorylase [Thiogranum sp.]
MQPDSSKNLKTVFFVSDRTGLTAEIYGRSLLSQFPGVAFDSRPYPFVDSEEKARALAREIALVEQSSGYAPVVFSTLVEPQVQRIIAATNACVIDLFSTFIDPLERCLGQESAHTRGLLHSTFGTRTYQDRLNAIDFVLTHDDGLRPDQYSDADIVLVGVSRCGKTPTSLYLAMNYFIRAANYPLTENEFHREALPPQLQSVKSKLVALTIDPRALSHIREQRRPGSDYATFEVCQREVRDAERIFRQAGLPVFNTTATSIEEIAGWIMKEKSLSKPVAR